MFYDRRGSMMKKRMRKLTALFMAMLLLFSGCAKTEEPVIEEENDITIEEVVEEESVEEIVKEAVPLSVHTTTNHKTYYLEEETPYFYLQYCDVSVEGDNFEKLAKNVENWSLEQNENLRGVHETFKERAEAEAKDNENFYGYTLYQEVSMARADERILSLLNDTHQYTGGENSVFYREGINFDAQSGEKLELKDLLIDYESFLEDANNRLISKLEQVYGDELFAEYAEIIDTMWQNVKDPEWYLDATGLVIVLQENQVGPATMGIPEIHLPYKEFERYIKEIYLPGNYEGVAHIEKNEELFLELAHTEEPIPMMLEYEWEDYLANCALWLGKQKVSISDFASLEDAYLVRTGGEVYCLVEMDMASDDYVTFLYRLTNGVIEEAVQVNAAIDSGNINAKEIVMEAWVYFLGTYGGVKTYRFAENHGFTTEDEEYILSDNEFVLTTTVDLPVTLEGTESTLPAGSRIILTATDSESYVKFTIQETGQNGKLEVQRGTEERYRLFINGMDQNECFEMLPYAG